MVQSQQIWTIQSSKTRFALSVFKTCCFFFVIIAGLLHFSWRKWNRSSSTVCSALKLQKTATNLLESSWGQQQHSIYLSAIYLSSTNWMNIAFKLFDMLFSLQKQFFLLFKSLILCYIVPLFFLHPSPKLQLCLYPCFFFF